MEQQLSIEYIAGTNEIVLVAVYPGGHKHQTTLTAGECEDLIRSAVKARNKYRA